MRLFKTNTICNTAVILLERPLTTVPHFGRVCFIICLFSSKIVTWKYMFLYVGNTMKWKSGWKVLQDQIISVTNRVKFRFLKYSTLWIAGSFPERYQHLSMKHAFGFSWIAEHCDNAKYVLKADDDVIVNLPFLQTVLNVSPLRRAILGRRILLLFVRKVHEFNKVPCGIL